MATATALKKKIITRKSIRALITSSVNELDTLLASDPMDTTALQALQKKLQRLSNEMIAADDAIKDIMLDTIDGLKDADEVNEREAKYLAEIQVMDSYATKIETALVKIEQVLPAESSDERSEASFITTQDNSNFKLRVKLPKIEIRKFLGELSDWLGWLSQFAKIYERTDMSDSDKFDYLFAAQKVGTHAYDLVEAEVYPMTEENYPKAIEALKSRYDNPKILKQLYVQEFLKLVISNAKRGTKVSLIKLFDQLEAHLRALETLKVTPEQISEFVFPVVESALPEDILIAWQCSPYYQAKSVAQDGATPKTELNYLMTFLAEEAESETKQKLVRLGFEWTPAPKKANENHQREILTPAMATSLNSMSFL